MAAVVVMRDNTRLFLWDPSENVKAADKMANITQIGDVGGDAEEIDTTAIDSMAKEFELGFVDNGTLSLTENVTDNEYAKMAQLMTSAQDVNWGISSFNKSGVQIIGIKGKGIVKSAKLTGISVSGLLQVTSDIRVNGEITQDFVDPIGYHGGVPVTGISVAGLGGASTINTEGGTLQMIATITPNNATNKNVVWSVSDDSKAEISQLGVLTAKGNGTVTVTATAADGSGVTGTASITISNQE